MASLRGRGMKATCATAYCRATCDQSFGRPEVRELNALTAYPILAYGNACHTVARDSVRPEAYVNAVRARCEAGCLRPQDVEYHTDTRRKERAGTLQNRETTHIRCIECDTPRKVTPVVHTDICGSAGWAGRRRPESCGRAGRAMIEPGAIEQVKEIVQGYPERTRPERYRRAASDGQRGGGVPGLQRSNARPAGRGITFVWVGGRRKFAIADLLEFQRRNTNPAAAE